MGYLSKDTLNPRFTELQRAVKRLFILQRDAYFGNGLWKYIPTKTYKEFAQTEDLIYDIVSEIVDETIKNGDMDCQTEDIRSVYLNSESESMDNVLNETYFFIFFDSTQLRRRYQRQKGRYYRLHSSWNRNRKS